MGALLPSGLVSSFSHSFSETPMSETLPSVRVVPQPRFTLHAVEPQAYAGLRLLDQHLA